MSLTNIFSSNFENTVIGGTENNLWISDQRIEGVNYDEPSGTIADRKIYLIDPLSGNDRNTKGLGLWGKEALSDPLLDKVRIQSPTPSTLNAQTMLYQFRFKLVGGFDIIKQLAVTLDAYFLNVGEFYVGLPWGGAPHSLRITHKIIKPDATANTDLYLQTYAMKITGTEGAGTYELQWVADTADILSYPLPLDEWLNIQILYVRGTDDTDGRYIIKIRADSDTAWATVCDVTEYMYNPDAVGPVNLSLMHALKLYVHKALVDVCDANASILETHYDDVGVYIS